MISINGKIVNKDIKNINLSFNNLTHLPVDIWHLTQLIRLHLSDNMIENILNPIIQRVIQCIENINKNK